MSLVSYYFIGLRHGEFHNYLQLHYTDNNEIFLHRNVQVRTPWFFCNIVSLAAPVLRLSLRFLLTVLWQKLTQCILIKTFQNTRCHILEDTIFQNKNIISMDRNHYCVVTVSQVFKKFSTLNGDPHIQYRITTVRFWPDQFSPSLTSCSLRCTLCPVIFYVFFVLLLFSPRLPPPSLSRKVLSPPILFTFSRNCIRNAKINRKQNT
jgi:hypothetical protein